MCQKTAGCVEKTAGCVEKLLGVCTFDTGLSGSLVEFWVRRLYVQYSANGGLSEIGTSCFFVLNLH